MVTASNFIQKPLPSLVTPKKILRSSNSPTGTGTSLPRAEMGLTSNYCLRLLYDFLTLGQNKLNVTWVGHVRVDTTVSPVCSSSLFGGLVNLDVLDDEVAGVKAFGVGIGLSVLEETEDEGS